MITLGTQDIDIVAPEFKGLSSAEVEDRVADGRVNADAGPQTKTIPQIIATHAFTLFNGINIILACLVAYTGASSTSSRFRRNAPSRFVAMAGMSKSGMPRSFSMTCSFCDAVTRSLLTPRLFGEGLALTRAC